MSESESIRLSVITPCYNANQYIEKCILHVAEEIVEGVEHLVIDGGSTDGTAEKIEILGRQFPHLSFLIEKDKGQSDAMNKGISRARGKYISFLNVDDYYEPGAISFVIQYLGENPGTVCLVGHCIVRFSDGSISFVNRPKRLRFRDLASGTSFPVNPSAYFYLKSTHNVLGGYDVNNHYNMDLDWMLRLSASHQLSYVDKDLGNFLLVEESKTQRDQSEGHAELRKKELLALHISRLQVFQQILIRGTWFCFELQNRWIQAFRWVSLPLRMVRDKIKSIQE